MMEVSDDLLITEKKHSWQVFFVFKEAFSLLAYSNPWASPVGKQLSPSKREPICAKLNSAILGNYNR
jgi:hypothetical protein